jgi:hypothetical protein
MRMAAWYVIAPLILSTDSARIDAFGVEPEFLRHQLLPWFGPSREATRSLRLKKGLGLGRGALNCLSRSTAARHRSLIASGTKTVETWHESGRAEAEAIIAAADLQAPDPNELLAPVREETPGVLFTLSHGEGDPRRGWVSPGDQRSGQDAMSLGLQAAVFRLPGFGPPRPAKPSLPIDLEQCEEVIAEVILGERGLKALAPDHGIDRSELVELTHPCF